jgi:hypothetical protein
MTKTTATAALLRKTLNAKFTSARFSVTTHRGGEFDAIYVTWIAGPTRETVEPIANSVAASENTFVFFDRIASA